MTVKEKFLTTLDCAANVALRREKNLTTRLTAARRCSSQSHRHDDIKKRFVGFDHARTQFINQLNKNFVIRQRIQRIDQILRIERYRHFLSLVIDRYAFTSFAYFR